MRLALIGAFAASMAIHILALFGTDFALPERAEQTPLLAELRPAPLPPPVLADQTKAARQRPAKAARPRVPRSAGADMANATAVRSVSEASTFALAQDSESRIPGDAALTPEEPPAAAPTSAAVPAATEEPPPSRLPPHGRIRYRVDRGDSNFEIGYAEHRWQIADGRYRITSVAETTGIVWLFKSIRVEMQSEGWLTVNGLQPERFSVRRDGRPSRERAEFDWQAMTVSVAERGAQPLDPGAQDFLSFNYQLGYLSQLDASHRLPIATGKKYRIYTIEVLGDEEIDVPAGHMRTLHLRAPGDNSTELWLAYDYLLLPVKIRFQDAGGASYVQLATRIEVDAADSAGALGAGAEPTP